MRPKRAAYPSPADTAPVHTWGQQSFNPFSLPHQGGSCWVSRKPVCFKPPAWAGELSEMTHRSVPSPCFLLLFIHSTDPPQCLCYNGRLSLQVMPGHQGTVAKPCDEDWGTAEAAWDMTRAGSCRLSGVCLVREGESYLVERTVWTGAQRHERELSVQGK